MNIKKAKLALSHLKISLVLTTNSVWIKFCLPVQYQDQDHLSNGKWQKKKSLVYALLFCRNRGWRVQENMSTFRGLKEKKEWLGRKRVEKWELKGGRARAPFFSLFLSSWHTLWNFVEQDLKEGRAYFSLDSLPPVSVPPLSLHLLEPFSNNIMKRGLKPP